jgi:hypothetical protein
LPEKHLLASEQFCVTLAGMPTKQPQQIACQQVLVEDNSVFSIQWTDLPLELCGTMTPESLLDRYLAAIRRMTWGLIQPQKTSEGVAFRLFGRLPLLCFLPPALETNGLALRICGGLLVQKAQCDRGELLFQCEPLPEGRIRLSLRLSDYCPLLLGSERPSPFRRWLYRLTQAALHRLVTIRFLVLLYHELGGSARRVETVQVQVREGRDT